MRLIIWAMTADERKPRPTPITTAGDEAIGPERSPSGELHARISKRAFELYTTRGYRQGSQLDDWLDAEREILSQSLPV